MAAYSLAYFLNFEPMKDYFVDNALPLAVIGANVIARVISVRLRMNLIAFH
jgi:hypothetical protein